MSEYIIDTRDVHKVYNPGMDSEVHVLKGIDLKVKKGEFIAILGPSGSGKTTLLDVVGCLLKPTSGEILIDGVLTNDLDDGERAKIRGKKIGFVFQQYNLIASQTALENVELPMRINGKSKNEAEKRASSLLKLVGLGERMYHRPSQLSGGEQQRVAIARSLSNYPKIILADEPTGNLDTKTGKKILETLKELNKKKGYTIVVVTHDHRIEKYTKRIINLMDGNII
ncbi:MAG: ABC transporter ATP-binding protein [Candidatus Aenigmatarchaeota archaeon]|nr:MAG: ABC transporter ATP-binding protein [Candidatus Aenigmarchaeota archaeon]